MSNQPISTFLGIVRAAYRSTKRPTLRPHRLWGGESMLSRRQPVQGIVVVFALIAVAMLASATARAEVIPDLVLKARDVERLLFYAAGRSLAQRFGGVPAVGSCLLEDADDDGMADTWEADHGLDPADPSDAWFDPDDDHTVNLFEFQLESDPHSGATPPTVTVAPKGADFTDVGSAINAVAPGTVIRVAGETYLVNYITFDPLAPCPCSRNHRQPAAFWKFARLRIIPSLA